MYAQHIEQDGKRFFEEICTRDLEGIVAKRKLSIYKNDGQGWLKIKNRLGEVGARPILVDQIKLT